MAINMTPEERAEKIAYELIGPEVDPAVSDLEFIASQIKQACEEAVREAYTKGFHEGQEGLFQKGFSAARERAAKVVQTFKWADDNDSEVTELLAHKIRALKSEAGKAGK